jgi:arginase
VSLPRRTVELIGVPSGIGAQDPGCADGPLVLRRLHAFRDGRAVWDGMLRPREGAQSALEADAELCMRVAERVRQTLAAGRFPLVVGGDHSCAIGTWSGVFQWLNARGPLGLIWLDAHMDSHTFATTPSGALHGMPLACLLGHGEPVLTAIGGAGAKLQSEHVCLLGVRSYESGEAALLHRLGVRVIAMDEIRERGAKAAVNEALQIARTGTAGYGLSLDLDVLDPAEGPGVGSPVPGGILCDELAQALHLLHNDPALLGMEIVEYNPLRDPERQTAQAADRLFRAVMQD